MSRSKIRKGIIVGKVGGRNLDPDDGVGIYRCDLMTDNICDEFKARFGLTEYPDKSLPCQKRSQTFQPCYRRVEISQRLSKTGIQSLQPFSRAVVRCMHAGVPASPFGFMNSGFCLGVQLHHSGFSLLQPLIETRALIPQGQKFGFASIVTGRRGRSFNLEGGMERLDADAASDLIVFQDAAHSPPFLPNDD